MTVAEHRSRTTALLGPTNTGKTRHAIDRMLEHSSGMMGFPLRLLARENFDRVVSLKGKSAVALVTGEEKIVPPHARYFICTVESMPVEREVDFLAVDEVQMCADPERGHIFTDRLLHGHGKVETMFLGAETIRPLIRSLVPGATFTTRERLSKLTYSGPRKITRLKRRSAIVAFSANEVYAVAELMRRQKGGAALVLGALSPRTRNAQVSMYQEGDVDYLVATDAIGMGLNMNIEHVALAGLRKFDGRHYRKLSHAEVGQVAGRSGRYLTDGTFGPIAEIGAFDDDLVTSIEEHRFEPVKAIFWRNSDLDFRSVQGLLRALEQTPSRAGLIRARNGHDQVALSHLARDREFVDRVSTPDLVRLLWEVCQIPDFRKTMTDVHVALLARIFNYLRDNGKLPADRVAAQIARLDRVDGDIDTLMSRIAHVRTWTYISYRSDWLADAETWQVRTREIEDRLSDALHNSLTQRFVDRRTTILTRVRDRDDLVANVDKDGEVLVEGEFVGRLEGFRFISDSSGDDRRALRTAADRALRSEVVARVSRLLSAPDDAISVDVIRNILWENASIASLDKGTGILSPAITVKSRELLTPEQRNRLSRRLSVWVATRIAEALAPLIQLGEAELTGLPRGIAYRLLENLGSLPRKYLARELRELSREDRGALRSYGVKFGTESIFFPGLVKPRAVAWRAVLWTAYHDHAPLDPPPAGHVTVPFTEEMPAAFLEGCGYRPLGSRAVRIDILDRIATELRVLSQKGNFRVADTHLNLLGLSMSDARPIVMGLGYEEQEENLWSWAGHKPRTTERRRLARDRVNKDSPFAMLRQLKL